MNVEKELFRRKVLNSLFVYRCASEWTPPPPPRLPIPIIQSAMRAAGSNELLLLVQVSFALNSFKGSRILQAFPSVSFERYLFRP